MFIGLILGLALAAGVAYYLSKGGGIASSSRPAAGKDGAAKGEAAGAGGADRGKFDFFKILPSGEEPRIRPPETTPAERQADKGAGREPPAEKAKAADKVGTRPEATASRDRFYLQAGAFQNPADAENQRARLALAGWEASVQAATLPDKTTWHRVRVGPFDNVDEMNRIRAELSRRGFEVAVIKNP
jgi:cell division septation protein DedD